MQHSAVYVIVEFLYLRHKIVLAEVNKIDIDYWTLVLLVSDKNIYFLLS